MIIVTGVWQLRRQSKTVGAPPYDFTVLTHDVPEGKVRVRRRADYQQELLAAVQAEYKFDESNST
jgi:hypothetical protein